MKGTCFLHFCGILAGMGLGGLATYYKRERLAEILGIMLDRIYEEVNRID